MKLIKLLRRIMMFIRWRLKQLIKLIPQYHELNNQIKPRFALRIQDRYICLGDATPFTGFDRHYVFHTAWAARVLAKIRPIVHIDISSSLYFISNVSAFIPIKFFDYRPANLGLTGLSTDSADLCRLKFSDNSVESLSCMHVVEHIGLGRYGDPIDYDGDLKAVSELQRVLAYDGHLLFVVPVGGKSLIQFNAHRIYTPSQVVDMFPNLDLVEFSLIPELEEDGGLVTSPSADLVRKQKYACGCFLFTKKTAS